MRRLLRGTGVVLLSGAVVATSSACSPTAPGTTPAAVRAPLLSPAPAAAGGSTVNRPAASDPPLHRPVSRETTANWAGRLVTASPGQAPLSGAAMRLTVPTVTCPEGQARGETAMMSVWTGLGGWHGDVLYQAGVEVTCAPGNPVPAYNGFFEAVRSGAGPVVDVVPHTVLTPLATHPIATGDQVDVRVAMTGDAVVFTLADANAAGARRWEQTIPAALPEPFPLPTSAECVVERPTLTDTTSGATRLTPLPAFSPVFAGRDDGCTATDASGRTGHLGEESDPWPETVVMMSGDGGRAVPAAGGPRPLTVIWRSTP